MNPFTLHRIYFFLLYEDSDSPIAGFELNGGECMTRGGKAAWEKFVEWAKGKGMDAEYNNKEDLDTIKNRLTNRAKNKNKNQ